VRGGWGEKTSIIGRWAFTNVSSMLCAHEQVEEMREMQQEIRSIFLAQMQQKLEESQKAASSILHRSASPGRDSPEASS
jgi:hypothetical protein